VTVFLGYLIYASQLPHPGTDDGLVYYHVAQQIVRGEGITLPYIWNFLASPDALTQPAFGYWMPLATFITVPGLLIFGETSVVGALLPQILLLIVLISITYVLSWHFTSSRMLASDGALVIAFHPWTTDTVMSSEGALPTAVSGSLAYIAIAAAISSPAIKARYLAVASGLAAGLCADPWRLSGSHGRPV